MSVDHEHSQEHLSKQERRNKIASHIAVMEIGVRVLEEQHAQQEAIQDFEAREYQLDAFASLWEARESGADRGLIHLATGLGKTSVAVVDFAAFRHQYIEETGMEPKALFVVHQNNILQQASERFEELLPELSRSFYSNRQKDLPKSSITFATFQTLSKRIGRLPADYFDYIIYDEAHHIEAETYKNVVEYNRPKFQLGLTATPERGDEKDITDHFGEALYTKTLPEAIAEGHLATVRYNIMQDEAVKNAIKFKFEPTTVAEIQRLFEVEPRNEEIAYEIMDAQEKIKNEFGVDTVKTIVFCADVQHADTIAQMMNGKSYHSKLEKQNPVTYDNFRFGNLETITTYNMFNEGVDIPDARLIVFLRTTDSKTIFEQQLGRGLRKNKRKQEVTILDFVGNVERLSHVKDLRSQVAAIRNEQSKKNNGSDEKPGFEPTVKTMGSGEIFDFDELSINLIEKITALRERINHDVPKTITGAAQLWRMNCGDEKPDSSTIQKMSAGGMFISMSSLSKLGGVRALQAELGFALRPEVRSLEEAAELWRENFGEEMPTTKSVTDASDKDLFVSLPFIQKIGGLSNFKKLLGFEVLERPTVSSLEEAAELWRENFGEEEPTMLSIAEATKAGLFVSAGRINKLGSVNELKQLLGFETGLKVNSLQEAAELWRENFGEEEPTLEKIKSASEQSIFVSIAIISKFGGINKLKEVLGHGDKFNIKTIQEAAELWRENFGEEEPTWEKIKNASKNNLFISANKITSIGGIRAFKESLGFVNRPEVRSLEEAAQLWRESFGLLEPTYTTVDAASKDGDFISTATIKKLGGMDALKTLLGFENTADDLPKTLQEAANLWRERFGDQEPSQVKIKESSRAGEFISNGQLDKLGGLIALKKTLGFEVRPKVRTIDEAATLWQQVFGEEVPNSAKINAASKAGKFISWPTLKALGGIEALEIALNRTRD